MSIKPFTPPEETTLTPEPEETPPFPIHALPQVMRDMVTETSKAALVPECLSALNALGCVSASIGAGYQVSSGGDRTTPANLFILGIAPSGTGKGNAFKRMFAPFRDAEKDHAEHWRKKGLPRVKADLRLIERKLKATEKSVTDEQDDLSKEQTTRDLADLERDKDALLTELSRPSGFSVADVTRERLALSLSSQPGEALASLSPEGRGVIDVLGGRYGNGDSSDEDIYLSAYSRESFLVDRIGRASTQLYRPTLSVLWLIQPDAAKAFSEKAGMIDSGLLPRFLIANSKAEMEDEPEFPHTPEPFAVKSWDDLISSLITSVRASGNTHTIIQTAQGVYESMRSFTNEMRRSGRTGGDRADIAPFVARWGENTWRLALVLHAADQGTDAGNFTLTTTTAKNAIEIIRWFISEQVSFLGDQRRQRAKARLERLIELLRDADGGKSLRDLKKNNKFESSEVESLAKAFPAKVRIETIKTNGRPSRMAILPSN